MQQNCESKIGKKKEIEDNWKSQDLEFNKHAHLQ